MSARTTFRRTICPWSSIGTSGHILSTTRTASQSHLGSRVLHTIKRQSTRAFFTSVPIYQKFNETVKEGDIRGTGPVQSNKKGKGKGKEKASGSVSRYPPLPPGWSTVIGVECHAQISSPTKLFSCTLPKLDSFSIIQAVRAALAFNCEIPFVDNNEGALGLHGDKGISWDRKHYFYSDLTAGWQITQKYAPLAHSGHLHLLYDEGSTGFLPSKDAECKVRIEQIQVEQDTAKSSHLETGDITASSSSTLIDLNRSNTPLLEIVSGPDMHSPEQAGTYVLKLQEILRRIGVSDGNMDEGSLRCDVNVSIHREGEKWGTRCEVKNVNSIRFLMNAIAFEQQRQLSILQTGQQVVQETRGYDESTDGTYSLRVKEETMDYRFMPDPNLPPMLLPISELARLRNSLPELPDERRTRIKEVYGLSARDTGVLMKMGGDGASSAEVNEDDSHNFEDPVDYFEELAKPESRSNQSCANWLIHELMKISNSSNFNFSETSRRIRPETLGELIDLVDGGFVTGTTARTVLSSIVCEPSILSEPRSTEAEDLHNPPQMDGPIFWHLKSQHLLLLSSAELEPLLLDAMNALPEETGLVRKGDERVLRRLIGEVMKRGKGRTDGKKVEEGFRRLLMSGCR